MIECEGHVTDLNWKTAVVQVAVLHNDMDTFRATPKGKLFMRMAVTASVDKRGPCMSKARSMLLSVAWALCKSSGILNAECTGACPKVFVPVPVFPLRTTNLGCEMGGCGFSLLVPSQSLLHEPPGPIDDLGPGFHLNCASIRKVVHGHCDMVGLHPHPFACPFHTLLLVHDGVMEHAWYLHMVRASRVGMEDDVAIP